MKNINPTQTKAWKALEAHFAANKDRQLSELFAADPARFDKFSTTYKDNILVDYSKNLITDETLDLLIDLAHEVDLRSAIDAMFNGEKINHTEGRAVLHTALRNRSNRPVMVDGKDVMPEVNAVLAKIKTFCDNVISGEWKGYTGKAIQHVVNIGIGGSDLGPVMITEALRPFKNHLQMHFVSNVDGTHIAETLKNVDPETTLFLVASKTFTTQETMTNALSARDWFVNIAGDQVHVAKHFAALSTNTKAVAEFGIDTANMFEFWDWVGGRYSLWSCIGLPIALTIGVDGFKQLLAGAYAIDQHFQSAPFQQNIPVLMGLLGAWNNNFLDIQTHAVLPYDGRLKYFAAYLQQLEMESNGKSIQRNGEKVSSATCPIVWGEVGPNAQHAFYQLLHQGTHSVSCDFIAPVKRYNANQFTYAESAEALAEQHHLALSNCLAQSRLLAFGNQALAADELEDLPTYKQYEGNQPSSTILLKELNPYSLGMLIAMYEHKVFVQSVLWNINPFDQWGVEKGKEIANQLLPILNREQDDLSKFDASTQGLLKILLGKTDG